MSEIIKNYYKNADIPLPLLHQKLSKLEQNADIQEEFEYWIKNGYYKDRSCISVEGYTAQSLVSISPYLEGEGAFMMLIDLREHPERAEEKIKKGLKIK